MKKLELMGAILQAHDRKENGDIEHVRLILDSLSDMDMGKFIGEIRAALTVDILNEFDGKVYDTRGITGHGVCLDNAKHERITIVASDMPLCHINHTDADELMLEIKNYREDKLLNVVNVIKEDASKKKKTLGQRGIPDPNQGRLRKRNNR